MKNEMDRKKLYRHILWMLRNMPNKEDNPFKWNRWLGFLQSICFMEGLATIQELKVANKSSLIDALNLVWQTLAIEARIVLNHPEPHSLDGFAERWEDDSDSQVKKTWIIVERPGLCPMKKQPADNGEALIKMLKELKEIHPNAVLTVAELAYGDDLWLASGESVLIEHEAMKNEDINDAKSD